MQVLALLKGLIYRNTSGDRRLRQVEHAKLPTGAVFAGWEFDRAIGYVWRNDEKLFIVFESIFTLRTGRCVAREVVKCTCFFASIFFSTCVTRLPQYACELDGIFLFIEIGALLRLWSVKRVRVILSGFTNLRECFTRRTNRL